MILNILSASLNKSYYILHILGGTTRRKETRLTDTPPWGRLNFVFFF